MVAAGSTVPLVAIAGNPNTGKTTLFNRLTGLGQRVGNYPGVTVDRHTGHVDLSGRDVCLMDVPGCYSLSARSPEEQLAIQALCGLSDVERPAAVVVVVDATQLVRNLYLVLQVIEAGAPTVVALNMVDSLEGAGTQVNARALQRVLEVPVVETCARTGDGLQELKTAIESVLADPRKGKPGPRWAPDDPLLEADAAAVEEALPEAWAPEGESDLRRALALWALISVDEEDELQDVPGELREVVASRRRLARASGRDLDLEVVSGRYDWIQGHAPAFLREVGARRSWSERVDAVLLNAWLGFPIFLLIMGVLFQTLFTWSTPLIDGVDVAFGALAAGVHAAFPAGILRDFITEGLIAGVGSVLVFLPQILLLFLFLGLMEDSGYMARIAFVMDRGMKAVGLHGRAFIPLMSGFACAIPAILATRTMERRRDRVLVMMVVPLMTCSARLPVYTLIIGALFPVAAGAGLIDVQGGLMMGMYLFATTIALLAAGVLARTVLRGPKVPLILELPPYRRPQLRTVLRTMWEKGRVFVTEAGTVILACTVVLWLLLDFPRLPAERAAEFDRRVEAVQAEGLAETESDARLTALANERAAAQRYGSIAGHMGRALEPAIAPLGFDWKIGVGLIGSFAAREVFVATMGIVYGSGGGDDQAAVTSLRSKMKADLRADGRPVYTPLVGISLLVFFALACQCLSTVAVVKRETNGWRWPIFMLTYMTVLAWVVSFAVYQGGRLLGFV